MHREITSKYTSRVIRFYKEMRAFRGNFNVFPKNTSSPLSFIISHTDIRNSFVALDQQESRVVTNQGISIQEKPLSTDQSLALFYTPLPDNDKNIVLLITHGMGHSPVHFHKLAMILSESGITCVCHSLPGHHGSKSLTRKEFTRFGIEDYSLNNGQKLIEVANLYKNKALFAFGHSMGGCTSLRGITQLQEAVPDNLTGIILLSATLNSEAPLRLTPPVVRCFGTNIGKLVTHHPFGYSKKGAFSAFFNKSFYDDFTKEDFDSFCESYQKESFSTGLELLRSVTLFKLMPFIAFNFDVNTHALPVLNMVAGRDRLVHQKSGKEISNLLQKLGSQVTNTTISNAPHDSMLTHTRETALYILDWLKRLNPDYA